MPGPEDAELVRRTRLGDTRAYGELVARYQGHVYGLAYSLAGNWTDAEDIAQEAFIRAYLNLGQLRDPARFASWLRRVTFGTAVKWLKACRPAVFQHLGGASGLDHLEVPDSAPGPDEVAAKRDLAEAVLRAVASLPERYRIPLAMFHLDGLSYQKVADFLDVPLGTAKSLIHRARQRLQARLPPAVAEAAGLVQEVFREHKLREAFVMRVLDGVQQLAFRQGRQCTLIGSVAAVLAYHGEPYDYADLMGWSGAAFRVRVAYPTVNEIMGGRIHPGISVDALVGPHVEAASAATGYAFSRDGHFIADEAEGVVAGRIEGEIDRGHPVIAMNLRNDSSWGVIVGYDPEASSEGQGGSGYPPGRLLCRTYHDPVGSEYQRAPHFPWDLYFVCRTAAPLPKDEAIRASIRQAVTLLATETARVNIPGGWLYHWKPEYANGVRAYDAWMADLEDERGIGRLTAEQYLMYWEGHAWMYDQLHDARRAAAAYLRRAGERLDSGPRGLLARASAAYEELVRMMTEGWACFPYWNEEYVEPGTGWWLRVQHEELLGRRIPVYSAEWSTEARREGVRLLRALKAKEQEALGLLAQFA